MKTYKFRIKACKIGAQGRQMLYIATRYANNISDAKTKLYNEFEHILIEKVNGKKYDYNNQEVEL